ncbi:hypothetical protein Fmac_016978 [Flemingia macrophylla]|uniref:Uncharacterized protein n=1 Tax=Flemingia macrophylla TaxID=520843 RepID=A0ABD1ML47_9FABA
MLDLGFGPFMKVIALDLIFQRQLVSCQLDVYNSRNPYFSKPMSSWKLLVSGTLMHNGVLVEL